MKHILFVIAACLVCLNALAGSDIKVKSGKSVVVKENANAVIVFDFSNARWEQKESFKDWSGTDYEKRVNVASECFVNSFNENTKGLKLVTNKDLAEYSIIFKVTNLEKHQAFTGMWGQGKISVTGTIDILNIKTQEQVCSIFIDGYGASKDYNVTDGIGKCFKSLGKDMTKLK